MNELGKCIVCVRHDTKRMACERCEATMRTRLSDLRQLMDLAGINLIPGKGGDGRSSERSLGINVSALDASAGFDAIAILESWERIWREDYGLTPYGPASAARNTGGLGQMLSGIVDFLQSWLGKSCDEHPAIDEFARELRDLHRVYEQAAGIRHRPSWRVTCPADTSEGECGASLRVTLEDFDSTVYCRSCETTWATERLLRVTASSKLAELWLDAEAASEWLGVHPSTLRKWAVEGRIKREHGRYEVHSLKALVSA